MLFSPNSIRTTLFFRTLSQGFHGFETPELAYQVLKNKIGDSTLLQTAYENAAVATNNVYYYESATQDFATDFKVVTSHTPRPSSLPTSFPTCGKGISHLTLILILTVTPILTLPTSPPSPPAARICRGLFGVWRVVTHN